MLDREIISTTKPGVRIINVSRGPLIDESCLIEGLSSCHVGGAALDVFESEPLPGTSQLRGFENVIFGTHNGSNTKEAVLATTDRAIRLLHSYLVESEKIK